jgi:hypothetical protein
MDSKPDDRMPADASDETSRLGRRTLSVRRWKAHPGLSRAKVIGTMKVFGGAD